jgi:hypothetical protein
MNLNDAVVVWGERAANMPSDGPSLPYPSIVAMTLSGVGQDPVNIGALASFASSHYGSDEVPMDMGSARCRSIDSQFYDEYASANRGRRPRGSGVMEASWLASDQALYYIAPLVAGMRRWSWDGTWLEPGRTGSQQAKFTIVTEQGRWKVGTSARAMPNLLVCANWARELR